MSMNRVSAEQKAEFDRKGFCVVERVIPQEHLALLRGECDRLRDEIDQRMEERGIDHLGLTWRDSRYFLTAWDASQKVREFVFSDVMAELCREFVGPEAFLVFEQFVVKCPEKGMTFSWHQDSGYVPPGHRPYVSFWCMLDDVTEENGTVYLLPYDRAGTRDRVEHTRDESNNDLVGYTGNDPGDPVVAPAGSIAVFSSTVFHRSGANTTQGIRRIYLPQYGSEPVLNKERTGPMQIAERFLQDGVVVRNV